MSYLIYIAAALFLQYFEIKKSTFLITVDPLNVMASLLLIGPAENSSDNEETRTIVMGGFIFTMQKSKKNNPNGVFCQMINERE